MMKDQILLKIQLTPKEEKSLKMVMGTFWLVRNPSFAA